MEAGIQLNNSFEYYLLAERYGWTHEEILRMTRAEMLYYLLAPKVFQRISRRRRRR